MEIYEYVHSIGNRMFPTYEIEEDGKEYQVDTACKGILSYHTRTENWICRNSLLPKSSSWRTRQ